MKAFNRSNSHPLAKSHLPQTRHPLLQMPHPKSSGWWELSLLPRGGLVLTEDPHQYGSIIAWRNYFARRFQEDWANSSPIHIVASGWDSEGAQRIAQHQINGDLERNHATSRRSLKQPSCNDKDGDAERQALNEPADIAIANDLRTGAKRTPLMPGMRRLERHSCEGPLRRRAISSKRPFIR
ncbi:hypothetical protein VNO77_44256 [Canavalia gladiata]|uniref:Uncharacterized protein n=1 Tax=Canavalia gladiata TaxID=3824 RepID=A0AAN9JXR4_CANGL